MELWGFKGLEKLGKTNLHFYKFILVVKQSAADNFVYGELGKRPCHFRFRWKQVKFWNRLIGLQQCRLVYKALQVALELDNNSSFVRNTENILKLNMLSY